MSRYILLTLLLTILLGCGSKSKEKIRIVNDTIFVQVEKEVKDTIRITKTDTVVALSEEGAVALYKLERIKRYVQITEARPDNKKFFFGWIKRVVE